MSETGKRLERIEDIFHRARPLNKTVRGRYLDEACADDDALRAEVEALLRRADLETDPGRLRADVEQTLNVAESGDLAPGQQVGPYRMVRKLGEGGMGEVWLAEQDEPLRRRVALKVIKFGMDTRQVVKRFHTERQALALMEHPAIASVFDADSTPNGRPYFAMEYVDGPSITGYCNENRLTTRERLALFLKVCDGVRHAHQKALIHRDLKPSNVLVTEQDGKPVPKIIDFGVAKAMDPSISRHSTHTHLGQRIGTPAYMSPEQANPGSVNLDTRSDVYALGVLLYELLTGVLPFEMNRTDDSDVEAVLRRIREEPPTRPSARLTGGRESDEEPARLRRTTLPSLRREISGDLDWIVLKALEKEPRRRYGSVGELSEDIDRFLANEAVLATPPSTVYHAKKFIRRHTAGVLVAGATLVFLLGFSTTLVIQNQRIAAQRDGRQQVVDFLETIFAMSSPASARFGIDNLRETLARSAEQIDDLDEPAVRAEVSVTMGKVYSNLGLHEQADKLLQRVTDGMPGASVDDMLEARGSLALSYARQDNFKEAATEAAETVEAMTARYGSLDVRTLAVRGTHARALRGLDRADDALQEYREIWQALREHHGERHIQTVNALGNLGVSLMDEGRAEEAETSIREALDLYGETVGPDHPAAIGLKRNLGGILNTMGRYDEAIGTLQEALEASLRVLGERHTETLSARQNLAVSFLTVGRYVEAEDVMVKLLAAQRETLRSDHSATLDTMMNLGTLYSQTDQLDKAEPLYEEALRTRTRTLGAEHPRTLNVANNMGMLLLNQEQYERAQEQFAETLEIRDRVLGSENPNTLLTKGNLALAYLRLGRFDKSESLYLEVLETEERILGVGHPQTAIALHNLACLYRDVGNFTKSVLFFERNLEVDEKALGPDHPFMADNLREYAKLRRKMGEVATAMRLEARETEIRKKQF